MQTLSKFCYHNYYILIVGLLLSFWMMVPFIRSGLIQMRFVGFIGILYPAGKVFQFTHFGSDWVRSYVADIGFTAAITTFLFAYSFFKKPPDKTMGIFEKMIFLQKLLRIYLFISFAVAVIAEGVQLFANQLMIEQDGKLPWGARGDINDVVAFTVSTTILILVVNSINLYPRLKKA